jgi:hypothetical protein
MMRILYESLDHASPSGGIRRLYRHVEILRKHDLPAFILHHTPGFAVTWFQSDAPVTYWTDDFEFSADDVLVIPEGHAGVMQKTRAAACERIVIALNWANIYRNLPVGSDWRTFGLRRVIAGSRYEQEFIRRSMGLDSTVLASGTDTDLFRERGPKKLQIAYMPRKNAHIFHAIACVFRSRFPEWAHVAFVPIDELSHEAVAAVMSESAVFLATSFPEGLARPPIEAMASACIVVGFAGLGSLEYMHHGENCYRAEDLDLMTAAEYLDAALRDLQNTGAREMKAAARETALRYTLAIEERAVLAYWRTTLAAIESERADADADAGAGAARSTAQSGA